MCYFSATPFVYPAPVLLSVVRGFGVRGSNRRTREHTNHRFMHELLAFGPVEEDARTQLERCLAKGGEEARGVLCADHHKGYSMPIGGVLASQSVVMPAGVGYDIACGNCAVRTNLKASDLDVGDVMDEIWHTISFGVGRKNDEPIREAPVFDAIAHSSVPHQRALLD